MHEQLDLYAARVCSELGRAPDAPARVAMTLLRKRAWSSPFALLRSLEHRAGGLESRVEDVQPLLPLSPHDRDDEMPDVLLTPGLSRAPTERRWLALLASLASRAALEWRKLCVLRRLLARIGEPVLVFTEYRDTLAWLSSHLDPAVAPDVLHGGLSEREREDAVERFCRGGTRVLLATDAAGLGLNLHARCRVVVNVELPWNAARLEQRSGRVDRFGQTRRVHVRQLVGAATGEEALLERLGRRVSGMREQLGDGGAVLDTWSVANRGFDGATRAVARAASPSSGARFFVLRARARRERRGRPSSRDALPTRPTVSVVVRRRGLRGPWPPLPPGCYAVNVCRVLDPDGQLVAARTVITWESTRVPAAGLPDAGTVDWRIARHVADWLTGARALVDRFAARGGAPRGARFAHAPATQLALFDPGPAVGLARPPDEDAAGAPATALSGASLRFDVSCPLVLVVVDPVAWRCSCGIR
jgi:hypothetical protein